MALSCYLCPESEASAPVFPSAVCHHCGRPLCRRHRILIVDPAFEPSLPGASSHGVHCEDCHRAFHPRLVAVASDTTPGEPPRVR